MGLYFIQLSVNFSDKPFGEGVGLGVEEKVEDVSLLLEDSGLCEFLRGQAQERFDRLDHISMTQ